MNKNIKKIRNYLLPVPNESLFANKLLTSSNKEKWPCKFICKHLAKYL